MKYFDYIITDPLMWLVELCYKIIPNYFIAIIIFALIVRLILFPFSLWSQVQSVKLAKIKPQLDDLKAYSGHDWRAMLKEQKKLYKKEKYSTFVSILPLLLQIPVIIGVLRGIESTGILSSVPANALLPVLSALSAFALCYVQNICNVLAKSMGFFAKWGLAIFLTVFSLYFTITSGEGFGIYWISGNVFAIAVQLLCNLLVNPKKYVTYDVLPPIKKDKQLIKRQKEKQKIDVARFNRAKKNLVFYSEASGYYKYFKGMIEHILENSKIKVHYLTSDINDKVFDIDHPRFIPYYCGPRKLITVLMKLDCKVAVMSLPDLHRYQYKRSIVNKDIEYVYVDHSFCSLALMSRKHAYDHFDTIFCYGKSYNEEIRAMEQYYGTKEKKLVNTGYALYENLGKKYKAKENKQKTIIIAPSWQRDNILEICIDQIMNELLKTDYNVVIRPHPQFTKLFPQKIEVLRNKYGDRLQTDFSIDILDADVVISDWSSVAWEFSYATNKPSLFINTPMKIMNPDWDKYGITPIDIALREKIGLNIELNEIETINEKLEALREIKNPRAAISEIMYDNNRASLESGKYIMLAVRDAVKGIANNTSKIEVKEPQVKKVVEGVVSKKELALICLFSLACIFNYFIFNQFDILLNNPAEFNVTVAEVVWILLWCPIIILALTVLILYIICRRSKKAFAYTMATLIGLVLAGYIQVLFLNNDVMTVLTFDRLGQYLVNLLFYAFIVSIPILVVYYERKGKKGFTPKLALAVSIVIFGMQLFGIMSAAAAAPQTAKDNGLYYFSVDEQLNISKKKNILVFLMDELDTSFTNKVFKNYPDSKEIFSGFTYYTNNISEYPKTFPSITSMLTSKPYDKTTEQVDYFNDAWKDEILLSALKEKNYTRLGLLESTTTFYDFGDLDGKFDNIKKLKKNSRMVHGGNFLFGMLSYAWMRQSPIVLKPITGYFKDKSHSVIIKNTPDYFPLFTSSDADLKLYEKLMTPNLGLTAEEEALGVSRLGLSANRDENVFSFIHMRSSHYPYVYDKNLKKTNKTDAVSQTYGSFKILGEYFNQMKALGNEIYDNAIIIVLADHGFGEENSTKIVVPPMTSLLVKRSVSEDVNGRDGVELRIPAPENQPQLSHSNFASTILQTIGYAHTGEKALPPSYFDVIDGNPTFDIARGNIDYSMISGPGVQKRYFHFVRYMNLASSKYFFKYMIVGDANYLNNWKKVK